MCMAQGHKVGVAGGQEAVYWGWAAGVSLGDG